MQLTTHLLGGKVEKGEKAEYGKSEFSIVKNVLLFDEISTSSTVWMSHFDEVVALPQNFEVLGNSTNSIAAIADVSKNIYALQFHPEVSHTEFGEKIIENFVLKICKASKNWILKDFITHSIEQIKEKVGTNQVI
jgi:GMP synthase (glutamine-hydrolysing)